MSLRTLVGRVFCRVAAMAALLAMSALMSGCSSDSDDNADAAEEEAVVADGDTRGSDGDPTTPTSADSSSESGNGPTPDDDGDATTRNLEDHLLRQSDLPEGYQRAEFDHNSADQGPCSREDLGLPDPLETAGVRFEPADSSEATVDQVVELWGDASTAFDQLLEAVRERCMGAEGDLRFEEVDGPELSERNAWFTFEAGTPEMGVSGYVTFMLLDDTLTMLFVSWLGFETDFELATDLAATAADRLPS